MINIRRVTALFIKSAALLIIAAGSSYAHVPEPLPMPNVHLDFGGRVKAQVLLPDGSIVIGGTFDEVDGVPCHDIAKIRSNGTVVADWCPYLQTGLFWGVSALAADGSGNIFVSGVIRVVDGEQHETIVKLDGSSGLAISAWSRPDVVSLRSLITDSNGDLYIGFLDNTGYSRVTKLDGETGTAIWSVPSNASVNALALDESGRLYVAGAFIEPDSGQHLRIARMDSATGAVDWTWAPPVDKTVIAIATDGYGNVYLGGQSYDIGAHLHSSLLRVSALTGDVDTSCVAPVQGIVYTIAVDETGDLWVGGLFTETSGSYRSNLSHLDKTSCSAEPNFWASPDFGVHDIKVSTGRVYVAGEFSQIGYSPYSGWAVLDTSGEPFMGAFTREAGGIEAIARQPDGGTLVGGAFRSVDGSPRNHLLRLNPDGSLDSQWAVSVNGRVNDIAVEPDGEIYIGGSFDKVNGESHPYIVKVSSAGIIDSAWNAQADRYVETIALASNGDVYVSGAFGSIGGKRRSGLARLSSVDASADDWDPQANGDVTALILDGMGHAYAGGIFTTIGGADRNYIARISTVTAQADGWNPSANGYIYDLAMGSDGEVYAGGWFTSIGGSPRNHLAKLKTGPIGEADQNWIADTDRTVFAVAADDKGHVYVGGDFSKIGGWERRHIARLSALNGSPDSWNPSANEQVASLAVDSDTVYVGGYFTMVGDQSRWIIAALPDTVPDTIFSDGFEE